MLIIRWLLVVPASILTSWLAAGLGPFLFSLGGLIDLRGPAYPAFLFPFTLLFFSGLAFSACGAFVAPQRRTWVACCLAGLCVAASWYTHVLTQEAEMHNIMTSVGETEGAIFGVAITFFLAQRMKSTTNQPQD